MHIITLPDRYRRIDQVVGNNAGLNGRIENCTRAIYARAVTEGIRGFQYDAPSLDEVPIPTAH